MGLGSYPLGCTHVCEWIVSQLSRHPPPAHRAAAEGLLCTPDAANAAAVHFWRCAAWEAVLGLVLALHLLHSNTQGPPLNHCLKTAT